MDEFKAKTAGFRLLPTYYEVIRNLPDEERLLLSDAVWDIGFGNEPAELPPILNGYLILMTPTIEKSVKFEEKQKANGAKGGRTPKPKTNPDDTQDNQDDTQNNPDGTQNNSGENLDVDVDIDLDVDVDNDIEIVKKKKRKRFIRPSVSEVLEYCKEKGYGFDPEEFVNYFDSVGWVVGKSRKPMAEWKKAADNWEKNRLRWEEERKPAAQAENCREIREFDIEVYKSNVC